MATFSNVGKTAYVFNNGTWHPLAGITDASANYSWTGTHDFADSVTMSGDVTIDGAITIDAPLNFFATTSERDTALPSPENGTFALVVGTNAVQPQYYYNGSWRVIGSNAFMVEKTASHTLELVDAGKTIEMNLSSSGSVTIPVDSNLDFPIGAQVAFIRTGAGEITFTSQTVGAETVSILSKNSNKKIAARYTQAILVKKAANTWYLFGDLTA
jgi:hypothetical protein